MTKLLLLTTALAACLLLAGCGPTVHDAATRYPDGARHAFYSYYLEDEGDEPREEVRHGPYQELYENGVAKAEGLYVHGERSGKWLEWYENGQLKEKGEYVDGERSGMWVEYYKDGRLKAKGRYVDGERSGKWVDYYKHGPHTKREIGTYEDGRRIDE